MRRIPELLLSVVYRAALLARMLMLAAKEAEVNLVSTRQTCELRILGRPDLPRDPIISKLFYSEACSGANRNWFDSHVTGNSVKIFLLHGCT